MDNINKTLDLSIQQDIIILNSIIKRISDICNIRDLCSWLFPLKSCKVIEEDLLCRKKLQNLTYENKLEVLLDRAYVFSKLVNIFLEKSTSYSDNSHLQRRQNKYQSLGCVFENLWTIISEFVEKMESIEINKSGNEVDTRQKYHKEIQTEIVSKHMCDSCATATLCIKTLVNFFENQDDNFKIEKMAIRSKIFDITQFGCMLQVTSKIQEYFNSMCDNLDKKSIENVSIKIENITIKKELEEKNSKIKFLETELKIFKEQLENEKLNNVAMKQEITDLKKNSKEKTQTISNQNDVIARINIDVFKIRKENDNLKSQLKKHLNLVEEATDFLKITNYQYNVRDHIMTSELEIIGKCLEEYEKFVDSMTTKYTKTQKILGKFDMKLKKIVELSKNNSETMLTKNQEFCEKVMGMVKEKAMNNEYQKGFKVLGNPLEDFPKQIEENTNKIISLQAENVKLQTVLERFKKMSSKNS